MLFYDRFNLLIISGIPSIKFCGTVMPIIAFSCFVASLSMSCISFLTFRTIQKTCTELQNSELNSCLTVTLVVISITSLKSFLIIIIMPLKGTDAPGGAALSNRLLDDKVRKKLVIFAPVLPGVVTIVGQDKARRVIVIMKNILENHLAACACFFVEYGGLKKARTSR